MDKSAKNTLKSLIWTVYFPSFLLAIGQGIMIPILPLHARETMGANELMIGMVVAARHFGTMGFDIPAGVLISMFGLRKTMISGIVLFAIAAIGTALSPNLFLLIMCRLLAGVSYSFWSISRHSYIAINVPYSIRGRSLSFFGGVFRIGTIIGPLLGGVLAEYVNIRTPFFAQAVLAIITLIVVLITSRTISDENIKHEENSSVNNLRSTFLLHKRDFASIGLMAVALQFVRSAREFIIPVLGDDMGLRKDEIGFITTLSFSIDAMMFPIAGIVMDKYGRKWSGIPAFFLMGLSMMIVPFTSTYYMLTIVGLLAGMGNGVSSGLVLTIGSDLAPKKAPSKFLGFWRFITDSGHAVAPMGLGWVAASYTLGLASLLFSSIAGLGIIMLLLFVKEPSEK